MRFLLRHAIDNISIPNWLASDFSTLVAAVEVERGAGWASRFRAALNVGGSAASLQAILAEPSSETPSPSADGLKIASFRHGVCDTGWEQLVALLRSLPEERYTVGYSLMRVGDWVRAADWIAAAADVDEVYASYADFAAGVVLIPSDPAMAFARCLAGTRRCVLWPFVVASAVLCRHLALGLGDHRAVECAWACILSALGSRNSDYRENDRFHDTVSLAVAVALSGHFDDATRVLEGALAHPGRQRADEIVAEANMLRSVFSGDDEFAQHVRQFASQCDAIALRF